MHERDEMAPMELDFQAILQSMSNKIDQVLLEHLNNQVPRHDQGLGDLAKRIKEEGEEMRRKASEKLAKQGKRQYYFEDEDGS